MKLLRFLRDEHGGGMVEFAVVTTVFFVPLLFGIIEYGKLVWARSMVTTAAREGTRYAIVHGRESSAPFDSAAVATYVQGRTQLSPISVQTTWTGTKDGGMDTVVVTVSYVHTPIVKVPGLLSNKTVTGRSTQLISF